MSAHLYYENCPSATVLCGVVFPGATYLYGPRVFVITEFDCTCKNKGIIKWTSSYFLGLSLKYYTTYILAYKRRNFGQQFADYSSILLIRESKIWSRETWYFPLFVWTSKPLIREIKNHILVIFFNLFFHCDLHAIQLMREYVR